jgi:hypothetical protein
MMGIPLNLFMEIGVPVLAIPFLMLFKYGKPRGYREYKLLAYVEQPGLLQNLLDRRTASVAVSVAAPGVSIAAADLDHDLEMASFMEAMNAGPFADQLAA